MARADTDVEGYAERAVLGACLVSQDAIGQVAEILAGPLDFREPLHGTVYAAMLAQHRSGGVVEPVAVAERLAATGELNKLAGGITFLHTLMAECPVAAMAPSYARSVRESAATRQLAIYGRRLEQAAEMQDPEHRATIVRDVRDRLVADASGAASTSLRSLLVDSAGLDGIPEPEPLIGGVLFRDSLVWLIGPPGNGKSFVALDMAGAVGTGEPWQGHHTERGDVLYLVAEGVSGVRARVRAWEAAAGRRMTGVHFLPVAVQSTSDAEWSALVALAVDLRPALTVVDTQARVTVGADENAARDMGMFVAQVDRLRAETRSCVKVVHHQGRNGDHMRGSTALEGAATTIIKVAKADELVTVSCTKQKDAEPFDDIKLRLVSYGSSAILALTDDADCPQWKTAAVLKALSQWWQAHESDWVSVTMLVKSGVVAEATFHRYKKSLIKAGVLATDGAKRNIRYRLEPGWETR